MSHTGIFNVNLQLLEENLITVLLKNYEKLLRWTKVDLMLKTLHKSKYRCPKFPTGTMFTFNYILLRDRKMISVQSKLFLNVLSRCYVKTK